VIGDIMFLGLDGNAKIIFTQIPDPAGVTRIAKSERD
jgi:hypothetical protein